MTDKTQKKTRSIARRINFSWLFKLIIIFIIADIAVLFIYLGNDISVYFWGINYNYDALMSALETFTPLFIIEGVLIFYYLLFGTGKVRRKLRPLDVIANAAAALTKKIPDETKFHNLESAIDQLSPTREDAKLHTGDKDLSGLEQAVNNLLERMRDSYRQQSRFVSDASHELRTPIAVIKGYTDMLDRWGKQDEKILNEAIEAIKTESEHMNRLVEQLLFLARGDSGTTPMRMERLDLSAMMHDVHEESSMIDPGHRYEFSAPDPVFVSGDSSMLKQTARILVENASKYTPEGGFILLKTGKNENGAPFFTVQDSGIGMAQEDIAHVFERFYRVDSSRTRETGGTGLGLSIAKWIVDKHGGWFEILSREDLGTRISVCFPAAGDNAVL